MFRRQLFRLRVLRPPNACCGNFQIIDLCAEALRRRQAALSKHPMLRKAFSRCRHKPTTRLSDRAVELHKGMPAYDRVGIKRFKGFSKRISADISWVKSSFSSHGVA
jgi:hypothetical protein